MPSAELSGLTDALWLSAHDSVNGKPSVGEWPLGVGLAAGLLVELVGGGFVELRQGELFRTAEVPPEDPALSPVLTTMAAEEQDWPSPEPLVRARASVTGGWEPTPADGQPWPAAAPERRSLHPAARQDWGPPQGPAETRHRMRGHDLAMWISYLAHSQRAGTLVTERLGRAGLVERQEQHRLLRGPRVRFLPVDSVVAGSPATGITTAVQRGLALPLRGLVLAGLYLTTGLHHHALATLNARERARLDAQIRQGLPDPLRELLQAADVAVGEAAMR